jgi:Tfp pilus assembly protein PilO
MKASSKRFLSIITAISMFVVSLFIYSSLIRPLYSEIKELRTEIVSRLELIDKNEASIQQVKKLLEEYQDIAEIQKTTSLILPLEQNVPQGVNQISSLSMFNNLMIESLSVQQLAIKPSSQPGLIRGLGILRFNFGLIGVYENFKAFFQALETNITLMDLVTLKVGPAPKATEGELLYTLTVDTYYQSE